jgi:hypothetical protein
MAEGSATDAVGVRIGEEQFVLDTGGRLAFGRLGGEGLVGLDPTDLGISRNAGHFALTETTCTLCNDSTKRSLFVEYPDVVRHLLVAPGRRLELDRTCTVLVPGDVYTHPIRVDIPAGVGPPVTTPHDVASTTAEPPAFGEQPSDPPSPDDHLVLVALAEGYLLRWPRHDPHPKSYAEAAERLGVTEGGVRRRMDKMRDGRIGTKDELVELAIDWGWLAVKHLDLLDDHPEEGQADA